MWRWQFLLVFALWCATSASALADKRVALVIGNSAYQNVVKLPNPVRDAEGIAALFRGAGFDVVELRRDLVGTELRHAIRNFSDAAQSADIAVVYYAGHGIEVNGNNYLIPVDAKLTKDIDVEDEAIPLDRVLQMTEPAKRLRLVILDACRDNPFLTSMRRTIATRSVGRGLAEVEPTTSDTLIAFAAKAGSVAIDGEGDHSPFTAALIRNLATPGLDVRLAFGRVRDQVLEATDHHQEPFVYGSLGGDTVALVPAPPEPKQVDVAPPTDALADGRHDYELAQQVGTRQAWESFLSVYGQGFFADLARAQLAKLSEVAVGPTKGITSDSNRATAEAPGHDVGKDQSSAQVPANDAPQSGAPPRVAAAPTTVSEPRASPTTRPDLAPGELTRLLQQELFRVGCGSSAANGSWDEGSRRALAAFNKNAGTSLDVTVATRDALDAVRTRSSQVCPLVCGHGYRESGDRCIAITCRPGRVIDDDGKCVRSRETKEPSRTVNRQIEPRRRLLASPDGTYRHQVRSNSGQKILCTDRGCQTVKSNCHVEQEFGARGIFESVVCR
jgi:hypothetical protein